MVSAPAPPEIADETADPRPGQHSRRGWRTLALLVALYCLAATLLLIRLANHPPYAYNWEAYTAYGSFAFRDHPTLGIFRITGGLMTDSSFSPLVILPTWLAFVIGGVGLWSLRLATALLAATAVPLLWWTGRHFVGAGAALLAAILLALSPVFLLYGRTATLVGLSLAPALVTIEALRRVLHHPDDRRWVCALQAALIIGAYGYAPVRFLWPIAALFLGIEVWLRPERYAALRRAILITIFVPWLAISVLSLHDPITALFLYYEGRGEHVLGLSFETTQYGSYIRAAPQEELGGNPLVLAARLVAQNSRDFVNLLLDRDTAPVLTDYWNERGRLYPAFLAPFLALGVVVAARGLRQRVEDRLLLTLAAAWTLPMLVTSKVHAGRLIFFLPLLCLLVASGITRPFQQGMVHALARCGPRRASLIALGATSLLATLLVGGVVASTWRDYRESPALPADAATVALLRAAAATSPTDVALILRPDQGSDPTAGVGEATQVAALRLFLDATYRFVSLYPPEARFSLGESGGRPTLYSGNLLGWLDRPTEDELPCEVVFYVSRAALEQFEARLSQRRATCGELRYVALP